jgi:hypothetical protein
MADIVAGFKNQVWRIIKYDGVTVMSEDRIPLHEITEQDVIALLEERAKSELTAREAQESPHLFQVQRGQSNGNRLIFSAGENPHFTASLWRSDELTDKE